MATSRLQLGLRHDIGGHEYHFCESSNSFWDIDTRQTPFVSGLSVVTNGLKVFDSTLRKYRLAERNSRRSPDERIARLKKPTWFEGLLFGGMLKFVIAGKPSISVKLKLLCDSVARNWRFVICNFHPEAMRCSPILSHLVGSKPSFQFRGKPAMTSTPSDLVGESFSTMNCNTLFDSPTCTGITTHPFATPLN